MCFIRGCLLFLGIVYSFRVSEANPRFGLEERGGLKAKHPTGGSGLAAKGLSFHFCLTKSAFGELVF